MNLYRPTILMYHSVSWLSNDPNMLCTPLERFEAQMLYLKRRNLRGVSMQNLLQAMNNGDAAGLVGLTFDDGYDDFLQSAMPLLGTLGFSATVFVVAGMMGQENDWEHKYTPRPHMTLLDENSVREVARRGMEVGSHSMTHLSLSGLKPQLLQWELIESRRVLSEVLGEPVKGFCYPYGNMDDATAQAVRSAGYSYACSVRPRIEEGVNILELPRIPVSGKDNIFRFAAKLTMYRQYSRIARRFAVRR